MTVSKRLRFEILRRDNHTCRYCGRPAPEVKLTVDHVTPVALGGGDEPSNLVAACSDCNGGKSSIPQDATIVADVSADALRWSRAMQHVADFRRQELARQAEILNWFDELWCRWSYGPDRKPVPIPGGSRSILQFLEAGLTNEEIADLIDIAMNAYGVTPENTWKYFCGCCWKRVRANIDMASELLSEPDVPRVTPEERFGTLMGERAFVMLDD